MRTWTTRQWLIAAAASAAVATAMGIVTDLIPNPMFVRMIDAPWWSYPVWIASAILSGLLIATYVAPSTQSAPERTSNQRRSVVGGVLSFLAVGCPTCNTLVVIALGTSGAITWFGPMQPILAIGALALLAFALRARLRTAESCPMPAEALERP